MSTNEHERILIVDDNPMSREVLVKWLRAAGHDVVAAASGEQAFVMLRDLQRPIGWFYTRATLPGPIDGWILAQPTPAAVMEALRRQLNTHGDLPIAADSSSRQRRDAA